MECTKTSAVIKGKFQSPFVTITGMTLDLGDYRQYYVICTEFERLNELDKSSLKTWREKVEKRCPEKEHGFYFAFINGTYWYTDKILEHRKYNKEKSQVLTCRTISKNKIKPKTMTYRQALVEWVQSVPWTLKCTARYDGNVSTDQARIKMGKLYERIIKRFPESKVSFFYSTEKNEGEGHHNHFVVAIDSNDRNLKRTVRQLIKNIGAASPHCEDYQEQLGKDYLRYCTKELIATGGDWDFFGPGPDSYSVTEREAKKLHEIEMEKLYKQALLALPAMPKKAPIYRDLRKTETEQNPLPVFDMSFLEP